MALSSGPCASDALGRAERQRLPRATSQCSAPKAELPRVEPYPEGVAMPHSRARDRSHSSLNAAAHRSQTPLG
eukprot:15432551-Alexandrium_andersonii.AAC.1